jgi:hypothetical protein
MTSHERRAAHCQGNRQAAGAPRFGNVTVRRAWRPSVLLHAFEGELGTNVPVLLFDGVDE